MTCIVGVQHEGQVWLGGDSFVYYDESCVISKVPKVWSAGGMVFGGAGDGAADNALFTWQPPRWPGKGNPLSWARRILCPSLEEALGTLRKWPEVDMLMGIGGMLLTVDSDLFLAQPADGYTAIGAGREPALGVLYGTDDTAFALVSPRPRIVKALEAAERFTTKVRRPWRVVNA